MYKYFVFLGDYESSWVEEFKSKEEAEKRIDELLNDNIKYGEDRNHISCVIYGVKKEFSSEEVKVKWRIK